MRLLYILYRYICMYVVKQFACSVTQTHSPLDSLCVRLHILYRYEVKQLVCSEAHADRHKQVVVYSSCQ